MLLSSTRRIVAMELRCAPVMNSSEHIRRVTQLSTNFYQTAKLEDPELDWRARLCLAVHGYSTSRGAVYPALAMIWYLIGLPFSSTIRNGSLFAGFTRSTLILRYLPSR